MTYKEIVKKKEYFQNITWIHLSNCLKAFENRELLSASIWSAVFVESMLKDILSVLLNVNISTEEISSLIARLRNILNNGSSKYELSATDATVIEDIMRRADEIRLKRNRLVHDTGIENNYLESDADDIYKNVNLIITQRTGLMPILLSLLQNSSINSDYSNVCGVMVLINIGNVGST